MRRFKHYHQSDRDDSITHRIASLPPADRSPTTPIKEENDSPLTRPRSILTSLVNVTLNDDAKAEAAMVITDYTAKDDSELSVLVWLGMIVYQSYALLLFYNNIEVAIIIRMMSICTYAIPRTGWRGDLYPHAE